MEFLKKSLYFLSFLFYACNGEILEKLDTQPGRTNAFCPTTRLSNGSCPSEQGGQSWDFSDSSLYTFPSEYIELTGGAAKLKLVNQSFSANHFSSGTNSNTYLNSQNRLSLKNKSHESLSVRSIFSNKLTNLIGYWRLDGNTNDSSDYNFTASLLDDAELSSFSKVGGGALYLDGSRDALNLGASKGQFNPNQGTISFWTARTWTTIPSFFRYLFFFDIDANNSLSLRIRNTNKIRIAYLEDSNLYFADTAEDAQDLFPLETWVHVTVRWDLSSNNFSLYINGESILSIALPASFLGSLNRFEMGYSGSANQAWEGYLDELSLWNIPLTDIEITSLYEEQKSHFTTLSSAWTPHYDRLLGHWKFEGNWKDSSGKGNDGTPRSAVEYAKGKVGDKSAFFTVSGSSGTLPDLSADLNGSTNFSISFWISADENLGNWDRFFSTNVSNDFTILKPAASNTLSISSSGLIAGAIECTNCIDTRNTWYHHFFSVHSGNYYWYVNGVLNKTGSLTGSLAFSGITNIGAQNSASNLWSGRLDELAIWDIGLEESDILFIYNRQKQKFSGHFDSPILDIGTSGPWNSLSPMTPLPFGKGLPGTAGETTTNYTEITSNLPLQILGYWPLDERALDSVGGDDFEDKIGTINGIETGGVKTGAGFHNSSFISCDGNDDQIGFGSSTDFNFGTTQDFTIGIWAKLHQITDSSYDQFLGKKANKSTGNAGFAFIQNHTPGNPILVNISNGTTSIELSSQKGVSDGEWHFLLATFDRDGMLRFYFDGMEDATPVDISGIGNIDSTRDFNLCASGFNSRHTRGSFRDLMIWRRVLSATEVAELYRRRANRLSFQVKSCIDAQCECESYNTSPIGSSGDCDGDGVANNVDLSDNFKAKFKGPGGDARTSYNENYNRDSTDLSFTCNINTSDNDSFLCVNNEVSLTGTQSTESAIYNFSDFNFSGASRQAELQSNPYFQYRAIFEAEENSGCNDQVCVPELTSISISPSNRYYGGSPVIRTKQTFTYQSLESITFTENGSCTPTYQLSPDGVNYYYHNGTNWTLASSEDKSFTSNSTLTKTNIQSFHTVAGPGQLSIKVFLNSDTTQDCEISEITVN